MGERWLFSLNNDRVVSCDMYGVDIERKESHNWVKRLEKYNIEFRFCDITKQELPFENDAFDLVLFLEVLEHLITSHPPYSVFEEIKRVIKPGACLILSTPNLAALHKRILALIGKNANSHGFTSEVTYRKHLREYTAAELNHLLKICGFTVRRTMLKNYGRLASLPLSLLTLYPPFRDSIVVVTTK